MPILSFGDSTTDDFFISGKIRKGIAWASVREIARRKLDMIGYANELGDLASPPGNRLELLRGKLSGYYGIRINKQWRVIFHWTEKGPSDVNIVDYHS